MILADHCVYFSTIRLLRGHGYQVTTRRDVGPIDAADPEVLRHAIERDLILLTNDKGFGNILAYPPASHHGIIVLKIAAATDEQVHRVLLTLLTAHDRDSLRGCITMVDGYKYRLRK